MRHKLRQGPERPLITMLPGRCLVSVEAISWALNLAPVPADRRGQPSSACKFVLVGLANHAGPDGSGAFPSVATLVRYTGLSERTVRTCLDRLEAGGIIRPCDPDLVAARIKRAGRRPQGWDLDLTLARDDLNEPGVTVPESQSPVRRARLAPIERPHHERPPNGVQPPHPAGLMDHLDHEVQQLHLAAATRCNQPHRRGAAHAATGCSGCTRTVHRTIPETVRRPRPHTYARGRCRRAGRPAEFFAAQPSRPRLAADGRLPRWPRSPAPTPRACAVRSRCSPPGSHPPNCLRRPGGARPGRRGAVSATRPPGCSASTATRRARARAASRPPQPAAPVLPRRWPAPVPVHLRHRCPAVTDCERHQSCVQTGFTPNRSDWQPSWPSLWPHADYPILDGSFVIDHLWVGHRFWAGRRPPGRSELADGTFAP